MRIRRTGILLAVLAAIVGVVVLPASGASADPYCGITWGSGAKSASPTTASELVDVRAGRHDCYDRLVFDVNGAVDGYWVSYVATVYEDGSGRPVPLRGGARLSVTVQAPSYDENGQLTYNPANRAELVNVTGYQTFRQVAWAGSFEGATTVGLGVRARLPFRVLTLPGRVVVDVAHFW
ncbi:AMIN-like domain-containing (lipo)protein [Actinophytocola sp.]|uniref:AMIN-like domain-containing (lipo)protein n=1 Tax=Actinophytocola sp. TaxID=1872138 RepID=UPI002ED012C5